METIKNCPFCGEQPEIISNKNDAILIRCSTLACIGWNHRVRVEQWNTRATPEPVKPHLSDCTCHNSHAKTVRIVMLCPRCGGKVHEKLEPVKVPSLDTIREIMIDNGLGSLKCDGITNAAKAIHNMLVGKDTK